MPVLVANEAFVAFVYKSASVQRTRRCRTSGVMKLTLLSLLSLLALGANAHCEYSIQMTGRVVIEVDVSSHATVCLDRRERPGPQHWSPRSA